MSGAPPALTERFLAAVALAQKVHGEVRRSGTEIPYLPHLLVVTGLVIEDGGDGDQAIAAMLHDAVEDGGGRPMLERISRSFDAGVAPIVEGCSDTVDLDPSETWIERKRSYLAHLPEIETTRSYEWRYPTRFTTRARSCVTIARKGTRCGSASHRRPLASSCGTTAARSRSSRPAAPHR